MPERTNSYARVKDTSLPNGGLAERGLDQPGPKGWDYNTDTPLREQSLGSSPLVPGMW